MSTIVPRLCVALLGASLWPAAAGAQNAPLPVPAQAYPGDHVFVPLLGGGDCNAGVLDPARPPQVRLLSHFDSSAGDAYDQYRYRIEYWLVDAGGTLCGTPPPAGYFYGDVGALPRGYQSFEVAGHYAGATLAAYTTAQAQVDVHAGLPADITGLWYDPAQSGRGLSVTRVDYDTLSLLWFTHDAQGQPDWVASSADEVGSQPQASGAGFNTRGTPLAPGSAALTPQPWGSLSFSYIGCGRARLSWQPDDPAVPAGSQPLIKLTQDAAAPRCVPPDAVSAVWVQAAR
jgi:hypothetical protein